MIVCPQQPVWLRTYYKIQKTNQLFNILCFERSCIFLFRQMWKMKIWIELLSWLISVSSVCLWLTKPKNPHCLGTTTPPPTTATTMLNNLSVLYANWTLTNWCCTMLKIHYDIHLEVRGTSVLQLDPFTLLKDPPAIQAIWSDIRVNVSLLLQHQRNSFSSFPPVFLLRSARTSDSSRFCSGEQGALIPCPRGWWSHGVMNLLWSQIDCVPI